MPRLTANDYLTNRAFLRNQWIAGDGAAFADLPLLEQRDLHDYYAPSVPMTEREALTHRSEMTKAFPSLPQTAGRAFQAISAAIDGMPNQIVDAHRDATTTIELIGGKRRSLRIAGIARTEIDHYKLARALVNLSKADVDDELLKTARKRARSKSN